MIKRTIDVHANSYCVIETIAAMEKSVAAFCEENYGIILDYVYRLFSLDLVNGYIMIK